MAPIPLDTLAPQAFATGVMGPPAFGAATQIWLAGIAANMMWSYSSTRSYKSDPTKIKLLLWTVALFLGAHTVTCFLTVFHYMTSQQRDEITLYAQWYTDCFLTLWSSVVAVCVQGYMLGRAVALFRRKWVKIAFTISNGLVIAGGLLGGLLYLVVSWLQRLDRLDQLPDSVNFNVAIGLYTFCSAFVDIVISVTLVLLLRSKIMGFNAKTDGLIRRLMALAVMSSTPAAVFALMSASLAFAFPDGSHATNSAFAWWLPLPSLYACSLTATLAARERIRSEQGAGMASAAQVSRASPFLHNQSLHEVQVDFRTRPPFGNLLVPTHTMHQARSFGNPSYADQVHVATASVTAESIKDDHS